MASTDLIIRDGAALGYIFAFGDKVCFTPDGKVEVSAEQVDKHNAALTVAMLDGLDRNCEVGQGGAFYLKRRPHGYRTTLAVVTWTGEVVTEDVRTGTSPRGRNVIVFRRAGKVFRGIKRRDCDLLTFKRIR